MTQPKSTAAHRRDGTFRKARHGDRSDIDLAVGDPQKPADLDAEASALWDLIVDSLPDGAKAAIDTPCLVGLARWYSLWRRFDRELIAGEGDSYKLVVQASVAWKQFEKCASKFGMSTTDRARLKITSTKPEEDDPLTKMLKRRQGAA